MLYFVTATVEIALGPVFEAPDDKAAERFMQSIVSQDASEIAGTIREYCMHKVDGESASPVLSRVFSKDFTIQIVSESGYFQYDLGNPAILRILQKENDEKRPSTENALDNAWYGDHHAKAWCADHRNKAQESDDFPRRLTIATQIKQQLDRQLNGDGIE